jgi:DNA-binding GntR family transcriptional regulator
MPTNTLKNNSIVRRASSHAKSVVKSAPEGASATNLHGVKRGDSVSAAYLRLRELIVQGQIAPGSWVVEAELASGLGLSRTPVRGALQLLQREGYVLEHKGGTKSRMRITPLTREDLGELYRIVGHLEGLAGLATAALPEPVRRELCTVLSSLNQKLREVAKVKMVEARSVFELDTLFHAKIVRASSGPRLISLHDVVKPQIERYWRLYAHTIIIDLPHTVAEHEEIIKAIAKGNPRATERAIESNWKHGSERIGRLVDLFGERGSF